MAKNFKGMPRIMFMANNIAEEIARLKKEKNAVILAHNYQSPEVQDIADYLGDSLGLSQKAASVKEDVIVFCGVRFMAETAKILSPEKKVLIPVPHAACPLAEMITPEALRKMKSENPGVPVVSYVNTSASVKAETDICCTSSNIVKVAGSLESDKIIFTPDKHLANYLRTKIDKEIISWEGYCPTHVKILPEHVREQKSMHPDAKVLAHPECRLDVLELADEVTSTGGMLKYAKSSPAKEFIIATETGLLYTLRKQNPSKKFYPATELAVCPNMKETRVHDVLESLKEMKHEVDVPKDIRSKAKKSIERMLDLS